MRVFAQMKFSKKIFLAVFGTAAGTAVVVCGVLYGALSSYRYGEFQDSYVDHMHLLVKALNRMQESQEHLAFNAAQAVKSQSFTTPVADIAKNLGVARINIYDRQGQSLKFSDKRPGPLFKLFPELADKFDGVLQSPLVRDMDGDVGRHTVIFDSSRQQFIEVVISFTDLTRLLREMLEHDEDNLSIELIGSDNTSFGHIEREGQVRVWDLTTALSWAEGIHWVDDKMVVVTSIDPSSGDPSRLITTISTGSLQKELRKIQGTLAVVAALLIFLSWWLSGVIAKALLTKIEELRMTLNQVGQTQDYSLRVATLEKSEDELNELGQNLNGMLATLQSHQTRLLEAERDKARTQIAAQVAHDIRSPLMSMSMALGQIDSAPAEPLAILKSAVARVAGIVDKLAASAKAESAIPEVEAPKLTLIEPLIASIYNEQRVRRGSNQKLQIKGLGPTAQVWGVLQVVEVQTAISNIINNAFEAGATQVSLNFSEAPKKWNLEIKDNGQGIPADIQAKIFERSFTHGKKTGTGLGLFQAKAAIEWSGGTLTMQSESGQGTSFMITMDREKKPNWVSV
ncbi:MAG TPA: HAMP domain-containing sensor histidine kinase, partial [Bdellovibrio sp.]